MGDAKKHAVVGAAGVAAAAMIASPAAAALVPSLAALAFEKIGRSAKRRAERIVARMLSEDETPGEFAEYLNARLMDEDEQVSAALRSVLIASVDAIAPAALEPMALIGRRYLRDQVPAWAARGWIRVLSELGDDELRGLREIVGVGAKTWRRLRRMEMTPRVELVVSRGKDDFAQVAVSSSLPEFGPGHYAKGHAARLVGLFNQHHLGIHQFEEVPESPLRRREGARSRTREVFRFHAKAFVVIANAFPLEAAE